MPQEMIIGDVTKFSQGLGISMNVNFMAISIVKTQASQIKRKQIMGVAPVASAR